MFISTYRPNIFFSRGGGGVNNSNKKHLALVSRLISRWHRKDTQAFEADFGLGEKLNNFLLCFFFFFTLFPIPKCKPHSTPPRGKTITISNHKQFCSAVGLGVVRHNVKWYIHVFCKDCWLNIFWLARNQKINRNA